MLMAGTAYNSQYVFFDPPTKVHLDGTVTFDGPIVGIFYVTSSIRSSESTFKAPTVTYVDKPLTGLEGKDTFVVNGNSVTLSLDWNANSPGDYIRVITAVVLPEPGTWGLMLAGLGAIGVALRRQGRRAGDISFS